MCFISRKTIIYIYIYVCVCVCVCVIKYDTHFVSTYFIVDPFKSSWEYFDFWVEWIHEGTVLFQVIWASPGAIFEGNINEMTNTRMSLTQSFKELEEEEMGREFMEEMNFNKSESSSWKSVNLECVFYVLVKGRLVNPYIWSAMNFGVFLCFICNMELLSLRI